MLAGLVIRNFHPGDEREIFPIHKENEDFFEDFSFSEEFIAELSQRDDFKFFVAEFSGNVAGFIGALFQTAAGRAEIGPIAVKKDFQHMEIGRKLLEQMLGFLIREGIRRTTIRVKEKNTEAVNFFKKSGFSQEGHFRDYTKNHEDVVQMVKFL